LESTHLYHAKVARIQLAQSDSSSSPQANIVAAGLLLDGCPIPGPGLANALNGSTFTSHFDPPVGFNGYYLVAGSGQPGPVEVSWAALPALAPEPAPAFGGANSSAWVTSDVATTWVQSGPGMARFDMRALWPFWAMQNMRYFVISVGLITGSAAGAAGYGRVGRHIASLTFLTLVLLDAAAALGFGPTGPVVAAPGRHYWWLRNWANVPEHLVFVVGMEAFESRIFTIFGIYGAIQATPQHPVPRQATPFHLMPHMHNSFIASLRLAMPVMPRHTIPLR
jgi:hypothetical protein